MNFVINQPIQTLRDGNGSTHHDLINPRLYIDENYNFAKGFLDEIDALPQDQALETIRRCLVVTKSYRDHYESKMMGATYGTPEFRGYVNAWLIDCNNMIQYKKLLDEVSNEE